MFKRLALISVLVLLPVVYFLPAVLGRVGVLDGDGWQYALGLRLLAAQMASSGELPLWNPYIFGGMPFLATVQVGALNPLNWLFASFAPDRAAVLMLLACFQLALSGTYLYARSLQLKRAAALVAGLIFAFGGFMVAHIEHTVIIAAAVWLPWLLLAVERLYEQPSWRWIALGALFIALQIGAGHPQPAFYALVTVGAYALFTLVVRVTPERRWQFAAAIALVACFGLLLAAPLWLPALELARQGERAQISYEFFGSFALPPRRLLALVFPYFFGGYGLGPYRVPVWDAWWESKWLCGYGGLLGLLLSFVALSRARRQPLVWFWSGTAVVALALALGPHLPFDLNYLLYRLPGFNLFRCSYRNLFEFSFALAVLAGLGLNSLAQMKMKCALISIRHSALALTALVTGTALVYRLYAGRLGTPALLPAQAGSLANAEALLPMLFCGLSIVALWLYARRRTAWAAAGLVTVLLLDLASFGSFSYWRLLDPNLVARLADPPTVAFIKAREADLNAFRTVSQSKGGDPDLLNSANVSIPRGLQIVNGYDPLRLPRFADLAGQVDMFGVVQDLNIYAPAAQGLNLLNTKYLLWERGSPDLKHGEVGFSYNELGLQFSANTKAEFTTNGAPATELAIVSLLSDAAPLTDGTPVLKIKLHTTAGHVIERELQAGRDTAEWAYDRADVRDAIRHQRATTVESAPAAPNGGFQSHRYLARLSFERSDIIRIELASALTRAHLLLARASLYDAGTGLSTPLERVTLAPERWRKLASFGVVDVYENRQALPRAWLVPQISVLPRAEILRAIQTGNLPNGTNFNPADLALLEAEDTPTISALPATTATTGVHVTHYSPQRIELDVRNSQPAFLVLSEMYYPGWEAEMDGNPVAIQRADHTLRGIWLPPGAQRVVFNYRLPFFRAGVLAAAIGISLLLAGALFNRRKTARLPLSDQLHPLPIGNESMPRPLV
ncbi:MAG: YfhO family protein [Acidobacteria bacterium]|nr:YfhO family protein [Acidobacteriota bacterium]